MQKTNRSLAALALVCLVPVQSFAAPSYPAGTYNSVSGGTLTSVTVTSSGKYTAKSLVLSTGSSTKFSGTIGTGTFTVSKAPVDGGTVNLGDYSLSEELEIPFQGSAFVVKSQVELTADDYATANTAAGAAIAKAKTAWDDAVSAAEDAAADYEAAVTAMDTAYDDLIDSVLGVYPNAKTTDEIADLATAVDDAKSALSDANTALADAKTELADLKTAAKSLTTTDAKVANLKLQATQQATITSAGLDVTTAKADVTTATAALSAAEKLKATIISKNFSTANKITYNSLSKLNAAITSATAKSDKLETAYNKLVAVQNAWIAANSVQYANIAASGDTILVAGFNAGGTSFSYSGPSFDKTAVASVTASKSGVVFSINSVQADNLLLDATGLGINIGGDAAANDPTNIAGITASKVTLATLSCSSEDAAATLLKQTGTLDLTLKVTGGKFSSLSYDDNGDPVAVGSSITISNGLISGKLGSSTKVYGVAFKSGDSDSTAADLEDKVSLSLAGFTLDFVAPQ